MREKLFDLIADKIPDDIPVDLLPDVDAIVDHLLANDVVAVVRCKDCIFWNTDKKGLSDECVCRHFSVLNVCDRYTLPTDFCSYGERREQ